MIQTPLRIGLFALAVSLVLCGCSVFTGSNSNSGKEKARESSSPYDDMDELKVFVDLSEDPEEVSWVEKDLKPGETGSADSTAAKKRLLAVLRYEGDPARRFNTSVTGLGKGEAVSLNVESWFPAELVAKGQTGAEETLKGMSYPAKALAKSPYTDGRIVRVDGTDYFVLELFVR